MGLGAFALAVALFAVGSATDSRAATAPSLGDAASYGVLAGSTATNTGPSVISGDVGVSPGSAVVGFGPGIVVPPGTIHAADAHAALAQVANTTAYNTLAGEPCDFNLTGQDLGGMTLTTGAYCFDTSAQLTGLLTLDMQGDPDAVFIFQIGSTLTTASNSSVLVINGGGGIVACNAFWQVGSSATLGTSTVFVGNVLALTSITLNTTASLSGRALAQNGAVTLDNNVITPANCLLPTDTPSPSPSPTAVPTASPTLAPTPSLSPTLIATPTPVGQTPSPTPIAPTPSPFVPTPSPIAPTTSPFGPTPSPFVPTPSPFVPTPSPFVPTLTPSPSPSAPSTPNFPLLPPPGQTNTPSPTPALPNFPNTGGPPSATGGDLPWIVVMGLALSSLGAAAWVVSQRGRLEGQHLDRN